MWRHRAALLVLFAASCHPSVLPPRPRSVDTGARWPAAGDLARQRLLRVRGGERSRASGRIEDDDNLVGRIVASRKGFYPAVLAEVEPQHSRDGQNSTFCIQQVQGSGDCLFHSIAISMAFVDEQCHLDMYDPSLKSRVAELRKLAVETLTADPNRTLHLEGDEAIVTSELIDAAASQYGVTPVAYCESMRNAGVWGGGPEILALANALERPIHVFEPVPACNGTEFRLQLCGAFGSPTFDKTGKRVCIVAADDKFPNCKPRDVKRHGEGGNHFLALLQACGMPPADTDGGEEEAEEGAAS